MASTSNIRNSEIDRLLLDSDESSDESDIDFAQDEFIDFDLGLDENNAIDNQIIDNGGGDADNVEHAHDEPIGLGHNRLRPTPMLWEGMENYQGQREIFLENCGPQIHKDTILDTFLFFFDQTIVDIIVNETNKYASQEMNKQGWVFARFSRLWKWTPCNSDEIYVLIGMYMLMSIICKPTIRSYFSRNPLLQTDIFPSTMSSERFELLSRFLHFSDNTATNVQGPRKLVKISPVISYLQQKFQEAYIPYQNLSLDESLLLWKGRLSFRQYIPLKAAKFGIKSYELCDSSNGYTWNIMLYTGSGMEIINPNIPVDASKTESIVLSLMEQLLGKGYTVWMDNFYNSPRLAKFLKENKTDCAGTLRLNRKDIPTDFKRAQLAKGETMAVHSESVSIFKWRDKRVVSLISTYHNIEMRQCPPKNNRNPNILKPGIVLDYNSEMGGVDLRDQMLQNYVMERNKSKKWYIKCFKRIINIAVLNSYIIWKKSNPNTDHLTFRLGLIKELFEKFQGGVTKPVHGRPSTEPPPSRLTERHFIDRIPATGKKSKPQRRCAVCSKHGLRRDTVFWCPDCEAGLCLGECFKVYHTKSNF